MQIFIPNALTKAGKASLNMSHETCCYRRPRRAAKSRLRGASVLDHRCSTSRASLRNLTGRMTGANLHVADRIA
ncbi:MAG: hypothetical protein KME45_07335 [Stenomitos rutilans HA7619-LM2]|jgi:hypothetical protein|nr:hypothetical protein [Stenomitos rutilans HA7619-LM2]